MPLLNRHAAMLDDAAEVVATLDVGSMWDRYLGEFLGEWARLNREGVSGSDMERAMQSFMDSLSDVPIEDMGRRSASVVYNQGRSAAVLSEHARGRVDYVVRSEVLDANTCVECANLDGAVVEVNSPDFRALMPPARCLGRERCRGFYVAIPRGMGVQ